MLIATKTGVSPFGGSQTCHIGVKEEVDVGCGGPGLRLCFQGFDLEVSAAELGDMCHSLAVW